LPKKTPPPELKLGIVDSAPINGELSVILTANTARDRKKYGKDAVALAFRAAAEAVVSAIKDSLHSLGLVKSGDTLRSVQVLTYHAAGAVVGFVGMHGSGRTTAQVASHLEGMYGLVEYSGFEERAKQAWREAFDLAARAPEGANLLELLGSLVEALVG
jgi:hypothetical protein